MKRLFVIALAACAAITFPNARANGLAPGDSTINDYRYDLHCPGNFHQQSNYHYDPVAAAKMAQYAALAYALRSSPDVVSNYTALNQAFNQAGLLHELNDSIIFNHSGAANLQAFAIQTHSKIIVAVKGSDEAQDWLGNFTNDEIPFQVNGVAVSGVSVHAGFSLQALQLEHMAKQLTFSDGRTLHQAILSGNKDVYLAGHSLGGAVVNLYGAMLREYGLPKRRLMVHTFGAPSVGNKKFVQRYESYQPTGINMFRVRNRDDIVPYVAYVQMTLGDAKDCAGKGFMAGLSGGPQAGAVAAVGCVGAHGIYSIFSHKYDHIGLLRVHSPGEPYYLGQGLGGLQLNANSEARGLWPTPSYLLTEGVAEHSMADRYLPHTQFNHVRDLSIDEVPSLCKLDFDQDKQRLVRPHERIGSRFDTDRFVSRADYQHNAPTVLSAEVKEGALIIRLKFDRPTFTTSASGVGPAYRQIHGSESRPLNIGLGDAYEHPEYGPTYAVKPEQVKREGEIVTLSVVPSDEFLYERQGSMEIGVEVTTPPIPIMTSTEPVKVLTATFPLTIRADQVTFDLDYQAGMVEVPSLTSFAWDAYQREGTFQGGDSFKVCIGPDAVTQSLEPGDEFQFLSLMLRDQADAWHDWDHSEYDPATGCGTFDVPQPGGRYAFVNVWFWVHDTDGRLDSRHFKQEDLQWLNNYRVVERSAIGGGGISNPGDGPQIVAMPLNDTGIVFSGAYPSGNASGCDASHPAHQDCFIGRDAARRAGVLQKVGASADDAFKGFDYTKISNSGAELGPDAVLGSGQNDWACTRDNVTGLIWEVKVNNRSHLRHQGHTYTWYDSTNTYGDQGTASGGTCHQSDRCDTEKFVADVNVEELCGASNWRMPTVHEMESIVDKGRVNPSIDVEYFPNTDGGRFWSGSPDAYGDEASDGRWFAWAVDFEHGNVGGWLRSSSGGTGVAYRVRLVHAAQ